MAYVNVPKDLTKVKTKVLFNLTKRQLICFGSGALIGVPLFFLLKGSIGTSPAAMVMMVVMIPAMLFAMYEKNGQPLEVIIRNISAGSFAKRYGVEEGIVFDQPTIEFSYKNDALGDPLLNTYHALALKLATAEEIETIKNYAFAVNEVLKAFWAECGVTLVDFKLEFGKVADGSIVLADEISPDTCRLWDAKTHEKLDKDRFRRDLGGVEDAYAEIMKRLLDHDAQ